MSRGTRLEARRRRHVRVRKGVVGRSERPRLAVFRSNRYIYAQVIDDETGRTLASASSQEADLRGRTLTVETATEVGKLLASRAKIGRRGRSDIRSWWLRLPRAAQGIGRRCP